MTVTVVCDVLGEENNGTSVASYNLIRYLKKQGHTVRVLCADQSKSGEENFFVVPNRSFGKFIDSIVRRVGVSLAKPDKEVIERALNGCDHVHVMMPLFLGTAAVEMASAISTANSVLRKENRRSIVLVMSLDFLTALPMENTSHLLLAHGL